MRLTRALALGLLHGPAELLPVSSSAHAGLLLADVEPARRKEIEVALHAGTLLALGPPRGGRDLVWLVVATAPAALAGLLLERPIEERLGTGRALAAGLVAGAAALWVADVRAAKRPRFGPRSGSLLRSGEAPSLGDAAALGLAQAAALVPGVSRHGAALTVLRARGFAREEAHAISREASKPVLLGASALKGARLAARARTGALPGREAVALGVATLASAASTAVAARVLAGRGLRAPLWPYAVYRAGLAAAVLARAT